MTQATSMLARLAAAVGPGLSLSTDPADFARHAHDYVTDRPEQPTPLAIASPTSVEAVSSLLAACHALDIPVVPQGGLTGVAGGGVPSEGCLVLSMEKFRGIEEIDTVASVMTVRAGTPLQTVQEAADELDLLFPLDMGSRGSCTIGGNVAANAGGNRVLRYGMMRDLVLGLEVVLADGTVVTNLNKMIKNNAGYDLKNLFIGSEGTLGVVTRAVLRLFPKPRTTNTVLCGVENPKAALKLLELARSTLGPQLSAFEVMWRDFYQMGSQEWTAPPLAAEAHGIFVLIDALGSNPKTDELAFESFVETAYEQGIVQDAVVAQSLTDAARFWSIRDSTGEMPRRWGPCVNFDVSIPIGSVEDFVIDCRAALAATVPESELLAFGHLADSNIHVACLDRSGTRKKDIEKAVYGAVGRWSGSVSAEHGIGLDKRAYLPLSRGPAEIALMRTLKQALDPKGIMNPGKVI